MTIGLALPLRSVRRACCLACFFGLAHIAQAQVPPIPAGITAAIDTHVTVSVQTDVKQDCCSYYTVAFTYPNCAPAGALFPYSFTPTTGSQAGVTLTGQLFVQCYVNFSCTSTGVPICTGYWSDCQDDVNFARAGDSPSCPSISQVGGGPQGGDSGGGGSPGGTPGTTPSNGGFEWWTSANFDPGSFSTDLTSLYNTVTGINCASSDLGSIVSSILPANPFTSALSFGLGIFGMNIGGLASSGLERVSLCHEQNIDDALTNLGPLNRLNINAGWYDPSSQDISARLNSEWGSSINTPQNQVTAANQVAADTRDQTRALIAQAERNYGSSRTSASPVVSVSSPLLAPTTLSSTGASLSLDVGEDDASGQRDDITSDTSPGLREQVVISSLMTIPEAASCFDTGDPPPNLSDPDFHNLFARVAWNFRARMANTNLGTFGCQLTRIFESTSTPEDVCWSFPVLGEQRSLCIYGPQADPVLNNALGVVLPIMFQILAAFAAWRLLA